MTEQLDTIMALVECLNEETAEQMESSSETIRPFMLIANGADQAIKFLELTLWNSQEDERDEGEAIGKFVRREAQRYCRAIGQLRFYGTDSNGHSKELRYSDVTQTEVRIYKVFKSKQGLWLSNFKVTSETGLYARTVSKHIKRFHQRGLLELVTAFPCYQYRWKKDGEEANKDYIAQLERAQEIFGLLDNK